MIDQIGIALTGVTAIVLSQCKAEWLRTRSVTVRGESMACPCGKCGGGYFCER